MTDDRNHSAVYGFSGDQGDDQGHFDVSTSPKHHKKDTKRYVAFHSDELDSTDVEEETQTPRKDRKKIKKDRSNTFREKFKSIKVKKKEKESKEKNKEKEKEDKKEKKEKKKHKRSLSAGDTLTPIQIQSPPPVNPVFGVALEVAVARSKLSDGIELPRVFRECIQYLDEKALDQEGLYRVSGVKSKIDELKSLYNHGAKIDLDADDIEPNIVAGLLKLYLRELPVSVLTPKLLPVFDSLVGMKDEEEQVHKMKRLLAELPKANFTLISWLFVHLDHVMQRGSETKMGIQNISIVFSPTMNISHGVLFIIMTHIKEFFPDVQIIKFVEPVKPRTETDTPHSPRSIEVELSKQEVFLDDLHRRMKTDEANEEEVMEQMWEIQRTVTQLKRRLKTIRKSQQPKTNTECEPPKPEANDSQKSRSLVEANDSQKRGKDVSANENQQQRDQLQLEIDQGKTKLQSLIKEESINRQEKNFHEEDKRKKHENESQNKDVKMYGESEKNTDAKRHEENESLKRSERERRENIRIKKRNEEHSRILEQSKVNEAISRAPVKEVIKHEVEMPKEDQSAGKVVNEAVQNEKEAKKSEEILEDDLTSEDEEMKELLREELRLIIEQEELLDLSARLKDRIQREWNDVDRLQLQIDELKKRESETSKISSSEENSSSGSSDSGTDSDENNSDLEDILKELEKENEKLENQTMDLMKGLADERAKSLHLQVELRMVEECRI